MRYKVRLFQDDRYEVYSLSDEVNHDESLDCDFIQVERAGCYFGSLADCEAWIRLTEGGYMS